MKKYIKLMATLMAAAILSPVFTSCAGDEELPPMPLPEGLFNEDEVIGKGTPEVPLTVFQTHLGTLPAGMEKAWISGYIVGWVDSSIGAVLKQETAVFAAPASVKSNVLLAQETPDEFYKKYVTVDENGEVVSDERWDHCVAIQLVYDTAARYDLNLGDHPENLGKQVSIYGATGVKYFAVYGMKETEAYQWGPEGYEVIPPESGVFTITDTFTPDRQYVIAQGNAVAKALVSERGYLYMTDVTVAAGTISLKNIANSFFFESTDKGVRIRQNDGLYFIADATDVAMHTTENPDQPGCYFTVTPEGSDGRFTIVSNLNGKSLLYDTQYSSFGLYAPTTNSPKPQLYIRTDK